MGTIIDFDGGGHLTRQNVTGTWLTTNVLMAIGVTLQWWTGVLTFHFRMEEPRQLINFLPTLLGKC